MVLGTKNQRSAQGHRGVEANLHRPRHALGKNPADVPAVRNGGWPLKTLINDDCHASDILVGSCYETGLAARDHEADLGAVTVPGAPSGDRRVPSSGHVSTDGARRRVVGQVQMLFPRLRIDFAVIIAARSRCRESARLVHGYCYRDRHSRGLGQPRDAPSDRPLVRMPGVRSHGHEGLDIRVI
jgi:hypothetical protein